MNFESTSTSNEDIMIKLQGEMDAQGCTCLRPELEQIANSKLKHNVILNLGQVSFLDSSGVGVIVFLYKRLKVQGRKLEIVGVQGQPRELMELLRIDKVIPVSMDSPTNTATQLYHA